jgi:2-polyprenyl-3-methyl-5-hydroxy-6-metoxy-1,4-benzoquinol methylase
VTRSIRFPDAAAASGPEKPSSYISKRGYSITGIDLSGSQLKMAKEKAKEQGVDIDFQKHDARNLPFKSEFDLAIMLCEGAFPLMETDEMNFGILKNVTRALKNNGKFIFTTLNGLFPLYHPVEKSKTFDLMTFRDHNIAVFEDDLGKKKEIKSDERYYVPSEITWLLKMLGYIKIEIFGVKLGAYSRKDKLSPEDFEMLVVAEK